MFIILRDEYVELEPAQYVDFFVCSNNKRSFHFEIFKEHLCITATHLSKTCAIFCLVIILDRIFANLYRVTWFILTKCMSYPSNEDRWVYFESFKWSRGLPRCENLTGFALCTVVGYCFHFLCCLVGFVSFVLIYVSWDFYRGITRVGCYIPFWKNAVPSVNNSTSDVKGRVGDKKHISKTRAKSSHNYK